MISTLLVVDASPAKALTSLEAVKVVLNIDTGDTSQDDALSALIVQASETIGTYCRRPDGFGKEKVVETFRAVYDAPCLVLERDLQPSVESVAVDGEILGETDWLLDSPILIRLCDDQPTTWRGSKIAVTYDAGYTLLTDLPKDIERCCIDLVKLRYVSGARDPLIKSMTLVDDSMSFGTPADMETSILAAVDGYIRWSL